MHNTFLKLSLHDFKHPEGDDFEATIRKVEEMRPWFEERGYYLNRHSYDKDPYTNMEFAQYTYPYFAPNSDLYRGSPKVELPYSQFGGDPHFLEGPAYPLRSETMYNIVYAQNCHKRHVAMKLVKEGSPEYQAYRRLSTEASLYTSDPQEFGCVMPPLDFLELYDGLWFVVMPRWGRNIFIPEFKSIGEILHFMRCLLKGLSVLHKNLIVHRDIKEDNILVSHFSNEGDLASSNNLRPYLRSQNLLTYAFMDFDHSYTFALDSTPAERLRPAEESFIYPCSRAYDTSQGEVMYDPFAFDVASVGMFFCEKYQQCSSAVPMLAPFLDRMITRDRKLRFTASDALQFFDKHVRPSVSQEILASRPLSVGRYIEPEEYDRWAGLEPRFVEAWSSYRIPPLSAMTKAARMTCRSGVGRAVVRTLRKKDHN